MHQCWGTSHNTYTWNKSTVYCFDDASRYSFEEKILFLTIKEMVPIDNLL